MTAASGPAMYWPKSITRRPSSAPTPLVASAGPEWCLRGASPPAGCHRLAVGAYVHDHRAVQRQGLFECRLDLARLLDAHANAAQTFCHPHELRLGSALLHLAA